MAGYSNFTNTIGEIEGIEHLNSAFDSTVGHDHSGDTGMGKKVSYNDLNNKPSNFNPSNHASNHAQGESDALSGTLAVNITGNSATSTLADAAKGDTRFQFSGNIGRNLTEPTLTISGNDVSSIMKSKVSYDK
jgi:hypothetical protein